ncbi:MAG: portal protein [Pseudomonadota bacterium]
MNAVKENHDLADKAVRRYTELKTERTHHEQYWRTIAQLVRPHRKIGYETVTTQHYSPSLSSTSIMAHGNFAAGIYSGITNPATRWGSAMTPDTDLARWPPFAEWLDRTNARVHKSFSPGVSSFYSSTFQAYGDIAAFGNACAYDEIDQATRRFIDVSVSIGEVVIVKDAHGRVVELLRKFQMTAIAARRMFGDALPENLRVRAEKGGIDKFDFYHWVFRNVDFEPYAMGVKGKRWSSVYVCEEKRTLLRMRGYATMPFYYARWDVDTGDTYGLGPGFVALPSMRVHNRFRDATIRRAQYEADPVRLAPDRNVAPLEGDWRPGGTIYGAIRNGQKQVDTESFGSGYSITVEQERMAAEEIREAFYYATQSLTGRTGLSDEENRIIEEAKLRNWAPHADRIMEEYAAQKFERRWGLLMMAGQLDPVPEGTPRDAQLMIQYQSAAAMALRASEANAVRRFLADLEPLMQIKPGLRHRVSEDDVAEVLHEANTVLPQRILRSREEAQQLAQQEQQAIQAQQAAELAAPVGAGIRDLAQAAGQLQGAGGEVVQ